MFLLFKIIQINKKQHLTKNLMHNKKINYIFYYYLFLPMSEENFSNPNKEIMNLKFIIIGDAGVGKTSLLHYFIFNKC